MSGRPLRLLVIDDSALYRQLVRNTLREIPGVEVVGMAKSGQEAITLIDELDPDLLTLDVQMPLVNGIEVLRILKTKRSRARAIMLSSLTANGAQITTDALLEGAFDFIHKPNSADAAANRKLLLSELAEKIAAFRLTPADRRGDRAAVPPTMRSPHAIMSAAPSGAGAPSSDAVVIGTSTGGPVALSEVLPALPGDFPAPILIVQHMPPQYTQSLANRLNERSEIEVVEGAEGMEVAAGFAYIAPGGRHMKVERRGGRIVIGVTLDPPENSCRPAVDYLFRSAADIYGSKLIGVVMTGMGRDGTEGCRAIKQRGGRVITQDADGCAVFGMPKAVVDERLSDETLPLHRIAEGLTRHVSGRRTAPNS
ncbi:MAG: chemotaxis response regulator protein-glutamate methylesterase [Planctomycetes bacterium]|nr:chemotaxis response regulator protein-glutamate methylesterase [Planctomycetota bacterium]